MGETVTTDKSHKQLVLRIHKQLSKFKNPLKTVKEAFTKEDTGTANEYVGRCSTPSVISEVQTKTTMKYPRTPTEQPVRTDHTTKCDKDTA